MHVFAEAAHDRTLSMHVLAEAAHDRTPSMHVLADAAHDRTRSMHVLADDTRDGLTCFEKVVQILYNILPELKHRSIMRHNTTSKGIPTSFAKDCIGRFSQSSSTHMHFAWISRSVGMSQSTKILL
jgi:hypothetical protein